MFDDEDVDAAVGMTRKWDAREAGREVARNTIKNLKTPPSFIILFSTIHYKDHGGFEEFLKGVWDVIPKGTPLVGGTVAGFINNYGCYTRGATALAASHSDMDVSACFGKNTKRNPKKATRKSANSIKNDFKESIYQNKFLLNLVSGPEIPSMPGLGKKKIIESGLLSKFAMQAIGISQKLLQKGLGREDEVFDEMILNLPKFNMILGATTDNYRGLRNYQFLNNEVLKNSIVNLGISTDLDLDVFTTHGMKKTNVKFDITKISRSKHIIHEINNEPAVAELLKLLGWPEGFLNEKTMEFIMPYYPISLNRNNKETPVVLPFILKDSIMIPCTIDKGTSYFFTMSGKNLIQAVERNLKNIKISKPKFGLSSACMTILDTLGNDSYIIKEKMQDYFGSNPYILFFVAGEGSSSPLRNLTYANMSFNTVVFGKE
ncbi:MAG: FIST N-terminal domain-containing protein [Candidatus Thermoplasmatota archaeon]